MLPIKLPILRYLSLAAAGLLALSLAANAYQRHRLAGLSDKLTQAQTKLADTAAELENAEQRAAKYYAANQALILHLQAAQAQAEGRRRALEQALAAHPEWSRQTLPDHIRKALP